LKLFKFKNVAVSFVKMGVVFRSLSISFAFAQTEHG